MTAAALIVGFARTIEVVLTDGQIIDTIIHSIAGVLTNLGAEASAVGMLAVQTICNFFIPSGSGQAFVTMPIMSPLATLTGVPQQTAVLAYQFGDGFTRFEPRPEEHHDHLVDEDAGTVLEFHDERIEEIQEEVARQHGFELTRHRHDVFGVPLSPGKGRS